MSTPDELLVISSSTSGSTTDIVASGEIDAQTAPALADAIAGSGRDLRLDLSAVDFADSSGLRVLIDAHQRLDESGGSLKLVAPSQAVRRLLEVSGVDGYLAIDDA